MLRSSTLERSGGRARLRSIGHSVDVSVQRYANLHGATSRVLLGADGGGGGSGGGVNELHPAAADHALKTTMAKLQAKLGAGGSGGDAAGGGGAAAEELTQLRRKLAAVEARAA